MNTVELEGQHFTAHVAQGDHVKAGQKLVSFDIEAIKAAGYPTVTPIVVTNTVNYHEVKTVATTTVNQGEQLIEVK